MNTQEQFLRLDIGEERPDGNDSTQTDRKQAGKCFESGQPYTWYLHFVKQAIHHQVGGSDIVYERPRLLTTRRSTKS